MERKYAWHEYTDADTQAMEALCKDYRDFLDNGKTERECIEQTIAKAEAVGYKNLKDLLTAGQPIKAGDKVYAVHMNKIIALFNIGTDSLEQGFNILGAHIDSPRLDVKQNPFYEDKNLAFFDTHYYGGIKKYQWVAMPLALHGVIVKKDGTKVTLSIGEKDTDPVFCVTDLLPHLGQEQMEKKAAKVIEGENLDLLIGSQPVKGELKEGVTKFLKKNMVSPKKIYCRLNLKSYRPVVLVKWVLTAA